MDLTIVIVNYNSFRLLEQCLKSIRTSLADSQVTYEVIIVDNSPSKETINTTNQDYLRIIRNKINTGFGAGCNRGIKAAQGRYVLLLNPDIQVIDQSIMKLLRFIQNKNRCFAGGQLLNTDLSKQPSCGLFFNLMTIFIMLFLKGEQLRITKYSPQTTRRVDWLSGACLLGKKADFLGLDGFDEKIFLYTEEVDLLYRAMKNGFSCYFYPEASFIHQGAATTGLDKATENIYKGLIYFYKKHYSGPDLLILKSFLYLKAVISIIISLLTGNQILRSRYIKALNY